MCPKDSRENKTNCFPRDLTLIKCFVIIISRLSLQQGQKNNRSESTVDSGTWHITVIKTQLYS